MSKKKRKLGEKIKNLFDLNASQLKQAILPFLLYTVLSFAAQPPISFWPAAFLALVPWLFILQNRSVRSGFWLSLIFGSIHFFLIFSWVLSLIKFNPAIIAGLPMLAVFQGFYFAIAGAIFCFLQKKSSDLLAWLGFIFSFVFIEWFRTIGPTGSPLAMLGHGVVNADWIRQMASVGGVPFLTFLILISNIGIYKLYVAYKNQKFEKPVIIQAGVCGGIVIACTIWGFVIQEKISTRLQEAKPIQVALLQPNVSQVDKFASYTAPDPLEGRRISQEMKNDLLSMMDNLSTEGLDLIVTPESAITARLIQDYFDRNLAVQLQLRQRAEELDTPIIVGADDITFNDGSGGLTESETTIKTDQGEFYDLESYGALYYIKPDDTGIKQIADYHKIHLMPFGETIPFHQVLPEFVQSVVQIGIMLPGVQSQSYWELETDSGEVVKLGANICFEDLFPYLFFRYHREGVQLFVNTTNNAWFDPSFGSSYHFQTSRFRSIEFQTPAVRATNTGITAVVLPDGYISEQFPVREKLAPVVDVPILSQQPMTLYGRLGNWFVYLSLTIAVLCIGLAAFRNKNQTVEKSVKN